MTEDFTTSGPWLSLVQRRVAGFCLVFGLVNLAGTVSRTALHQLGLFERVGVPASLITTQAVATVALLGVYLLLRRVRRSPRFVRLAEGFALVLTGICVELVALFLTLEMVEVSELRSLAREPDTALFAWFALTLPLVAASFILTYAMVIRAAFVPTRARHTAVLTLAVGAPLAFVAYVAGLGTQRVGFVLLTPGGLAFAGAAQWAFTVAVCTTISHVIYGLRQEVRAAARLGQYTLETLIGEGGMGMVYRASHLMLRRPTAIKLLPPDRAGAEALTRFEREVQLTAQLTHPNTVTIYDYGRTADGVFYYAMELLDGATLEEVVQLDGPQPPERVVRILEQVAGALGEAHSIGLIHRDVKPANIVLCRQGGELDVAKVVDFGLVKEIEKRSGAAVSRDGTISGTPLYMAPEILTAADAASPRSDLYALGAVGYYLLTGEHVFEGNTVIEILGHHLHTAPELPSSRRGESVPAELERLILDCLAKTPEGRPESMSELRRRLEATGVDRWSQRSARMWWDAHSPGLAARRSSTPAGSKSKTTMAVDVDDRERLALRGDEERLAG